ncbi:activator of mitotic machinery Cdc14 phosphatase activation C-term-domain-containing protein [Blakeslea trispora]|nr:activator of mitotic machinery Cdc14 phosphatase activation C-term-domain-containing protein [Blakeslea trispora]
MKRALREHNKWTRLPPNKQDVPVQNSISVTRYKSTPSHNLSLVEQERSSQEEQTKACPINVEEDEVCQLEISDQMNYSHLSEASPKSKRSSWLYNLLNDFKKPHRLFLPSTKKPSVTPCLSDAVPKKQRSFESLLHRKKPQSVPNSPLVYTRYPIQTEHAIYRLSHQKLSNSHRPLQQQVMISNLMFWYLSVSNKKFKAQRGRSQEYTSTSPSTEKVSLDQAYMQKSYYAPEVPKKSDPYQPIKNPYCSVTRAPAQTL